MKKAISNKIKAFLIGIAILAIFISPIAGANDNNWTTFQENIQHTGFLEEASDFISNLWTHNMENPVKASPAIQNKIIYIASESGLLKAINMEDGSTEWKYQLNGTVRGSPVVKGDNLFIGSGGDDNKGYMYSYNVKNEKLSWKFETSKPIESTPYIGENTLYFGANNGKVYALNRNDGTKLWEKEIGGKVKSSPTAVNGTIYVGSTNGIIFALSSSDGSQIWNYTTGDEVVSSPAYGDGKVFIGSSDGTLYALTTNGTLSWKYDLGNKVLSSASLDLWNNNLYIGSDNDNLTCLDIRNGAFKGAYKTGGDIRSTPAIYDDKIVFGSNDGNLYILNKFTGEVKLSYNPGAYLFNTPISSSPVVYGQSIFFAGEDGYVYSLDGEKLNTPTSTFMYYTGIIAFIILVAIIVLVRIIRKRK